MTPVLVSGSAGFLGLNVLEALLRRGEFVIAVDRDPPSAIAARAFGRLPGKVHAAEVDILDDAALAELFSRYRPQGVIHAAALTVAAKDEELLTQRCIAVNVGGTAKLLEAAAKTGVKRFVMLSSASVYGASGFSEPILDEETTPARPESIYAITKFAAERIALRQRATERMEVVALRLGSAFGPWEHQTAARGTPSPMWQIVELAASSTPVVLPREGWRDWIYARDVAAAILAVLDATAQLPYVVNIGAGVEWPVSRFCEELAKTWSGFSWRIAHPAEHSNVDLYDARDRASLAIRILSEKLGYKPRFDIGSATDDYVSWIRDKVQQ